MDVVYAWQLIRRKLSEGRLPRSRPVDVWQAPGAGQTCDGCGEPIATNQQMVWGLATRGWMSIHFHEECFGIWDYERGAVSRPTSGGPSTQT